ncbi:MAG: SMC family ATPase [Bacteroidota bacterium]|jgi:exonuclease SbcC
MIITAIHLQNIKSFVDEELRFARGINIIAGRNGAGKSTIIEAVGLALFDAWPQRFRDGNARSGFLRNGENEGSIALTVLREGQAFTLRCDLAQRKKGIDYERVLLDGDGVEIARSSGRKKEFQDDIRRALLGESRIDDDKLFRDIIGTEQGAFDEPFTRSEGERKEIFEKILGISDFQDFEKQFSSLVKWQHSEAKELATRLKEHAAVPMELAEAEKILAEREAAVKEAAAALDIVAGRVATARALVDSMTGSRDTLQKAQSEQQRLQEKLKGEQAAVTMARKLLDDALTAVKALDAARAGHAEFLTAEAALETLRKSAKDREAMSRVLAEETTVFEKTNAELLTRQEALRKDQDRIKKDCDGVSKSIDEMNVRIEEMRKEYVVLEAARKNAVERAALAGELRSYVQDLRTTRDALQNAGEKMRSLHETFAALNLRLDEMKLEAEFLPALREETELMYARHSSAEGRAEEDDALARMFTEAKRIETQLKAEATEAANLSSRKEEEGKGERKQLELKTADLEKRNEQRAECDNALATVTRQQTELSGAWLLRAAELSAALAVHGDVESRIAGNERLLEEHRAAHASFLAQESAAALREQREREHDEAVNASVVTRKALDDMASALDKLAQAYSEEEYATAKSVLDAAQLEEKSATALHGDVAARSEEQLAAVKKLRKEHREYEKLRAQSVRAESETAFTSEVHQHVVRELARHVGASIVSALSSFAAELYTRIAPEQDLALHWDPQSYAVELRGGQGTVRGRELSGGQLMGVSLAVKLALIKWYSQCRIGFLDEPTTHLDKETRRHLADVIQHLEQLTGDADPWFDQLFVISHEESFSGAGHRIELVRDPESGSVVMDVE